MRYRAYSRYAYAVALVELFQFARTHEGAEFAFGPMVLDMMEDSGLEITGPGAADASDVVARIPGLFLSVD